jgi:trans-2-enoyl-CoA reductase
MQVVIYGCMSGKAPAWPWQAWVFRDLKVSGFNLRKWVAANRGRVVPMLEALGRLVSANLLVLAYTEYDLASELGEALDHALDAARNTKVLLSCAGAAAELVAALKQLT